MLQRPQDAQCKGGRVQDAAQTPADATARATADAAAEAFIERAAEEARGHVRWLRPEFQNPDQDRRVAGAAGAKGYLEIKDDKHYLTDAGKAAGGEFRMSQRYGPYFLWPDFLEA
ncbi:hypothetical protein [Luteimonas colneyensis]|uniref:hypothetical protein n=1 Tax=Luteimonas colneyensis TaxID=2762230 RepID=UPI00177BF737|nr:hypothetical protein [Luteimonas colneyensis]